MILHIACLPFPSPQGTQAAIDAMMRAHATHGHEARLLTYAHGSDDLPSRYPIHRVPDFPRVRSLRSGPSLGKVALDLRCTHSVRKLAREHRPTAIVAHHIEAAAAALLADVGPVHYVAHTSLAHELPVYFPRVVTPLVRRAGELAERWVVERAASVAAVAPSLAAWLGDRARYIPVPWPARAKAPRVSTHDARKALGLPFGARICLYAGNLDRYQGWEHLVDALRVLKWSLPAARLLVATESNPRPLIESARHYGLEASIDVAPLDSERARALVHAASDVAWVPRRTAGGLPIKMLDAFSRGLPVVAMARATADLDLSDACTVVGDDDPNALSDGASRLLRDPRRVRGQRDRAHEYLSSQHSPHAYAQAMNTWLASTVSTQPTTKQAARRRRAAPGLRAR